MARRGFKVILTARDGTAAEDRAAALSAEGLDVIGRALDVTSSESVSALAGEVSSAFGKLDVLVNNAAGIGPYRETAASADLSIAQSILDVTLLGAWRTSQAFLSLLRKGPHPRIVNVSSGAGSHGDSAFGLTTDNNMGTSYAVAKAALNALTVKLAKEERSAGVLVNAVCPGFTATFEGGAAMGARPVSEGSGKHRLGRFACGWRTDGRVLSRRQASSVVIDTPQPEPPPNSFHPEHERTGAPGSLRMRIHEYHPDVVGACAPMTAFQLVVLNPGNSSSSR